MGAGGTSLSRVRILAYYQVRYCYTCTVICRERRLFLSPDAGFARAGLGTMEGLGTETVSSLLC